MSASVPRHAVLTPPAAAYVLRRLKRAGVTSATIRADAAWMRSAGYACNADAIEAGWAQLLAAAGDVPARPLPATDDGNDPTEATVPATPSGQEVTTETAAGRLGVSPRRVVQLLAAGTLTGRQVGRTWLIDTTSVDALADLRGARSA